MTPQLEWTLRWIAAIAILAIAFLVFGFYILLLTGEDPLSGILYPVSEIGTQSNDRSNPNEYESMGFELVNPGGR